MLIAAFAKRAGMSIDTVRYYVRRGLLRPEAGRLGGRNPYQEFSAADLDAASIIRTGQALGLSLNEIAALISEYRAGRLSGDSFVSFLGGQRERLLQRARELTQLAGYLEAKIAWMRDGQTAEQPQLDAFFGPR